MCTDRTNGRQSRFFVGAAFVYLKYQPVGTSICWAGIVMITRHGQPSDGVTSITVNHIVADASLRRGGEIRRHSNHRHTVTLVQLSYDKGGGIIELLSHGPSPSDRYFNNDPPSLNRELRLSHRRRQRNIEATPTIIPPCDGHLPFILNDRFTILHIVCAWSERRTDLSVRERERERRKNATA